MTVPSNAIWILINDPCFTIAMLPLASPLALPFPEGFKPPRGLTPRIFATITTQNRVEAL